MNLENARVIAARTSKTIYREDDRVIKVFDEGFSKADILNEALNIARVEETGIPMPATTRYELDARLDSLPKHRKLCHGDFNPSNVIIKPDGGYAVLDWSHATQGNASADAARTYLLFWLDGDMDGAEKYLELFCKKTDTARH